MSGMALSARPAGKAGLAETMNVLAIAAAPLVMGPTYRVLQPRTGSPTVALLGTGFLAFALLLCAAGGVVGDAIVGRRPS